jgi:hypothetical protein
MGSYLSASGVADTYYVGDKAASDDIEVTERPAILPHAYDWNGEEWVIDRERELRSLIAGIDDQLAQLDASLYRNRGTREQDLITAPFIANALYGLTEPQLYLTSKEYKRVKDAELVTAAALRAQRKVLDDELDLLEAS